MKVENVIIKSQQEINNEKRKKREERIQQTKNKVNELLRCSNNY